MTATEIYESVTNGGASDFVEIVAVLNRHEPWCLIGGLAVNCFVEPVYTTDADIIVVATSLERIERELKAVGFRAQRPGGKLNVRFTTDARYQDFLGNLTRREVLGVVVPVASLENIVHGTVWAWQDEQRRSTKRKKDELDLMRIAESHPELRELIPAEIVKQL